MSEQGCHHHPGRRPNAFYLMLLPAFALLLDLLLLLQLLCDAGLSQRLALASLVGLGVEGRL